MMTLEDLDNLMIKLEIPASEDLVQALFFAFDRSCCGNINFEDFNRFIIYDPYN